MKLNLIVIGILTLVVAGTTSAQGVVSSAKNGKLYTQAQLKQLVRDAHTPDRYDALAAFYGNRQKTYLLQAANEKLEWERQSQQIVSVHAKYPRPVDSARYLYEYYSLKATDAGALSAKFSKQGSGETQGNVQ